MFGIETNDPFRVKFKGNFSTQAFSLGWENEPLELEDNANTDIQRKWARIGCQAMRRFSSQTT
jgi:hypothetical protein